MSQEDFQLITFPLGPWGTNGYILINAGSSVIIDPAAEAERILAAVEGTAVKYILLTHAHGDHIQALDEVRGATSAPLGIHPADAGQPPGQQEQGGAIGHRAADQARVPALHLDRHAVGPGHGEHVRHLPRVARDGSRQDGSRPLAGPVPPEPRRHIRVREEGDAARVQVALRPSPPIRVRHGAILPQPGTPPVN